MAEHELNKIVDDDGEVFNLRDITKLPKTSDPSKIVSAAYPQCFESTDFYSQGYLVLYDVTSAFDGTFDNVTTDAAHVAFSGFVQTCKYNGGGAPQFYKVETKINGKYPYNYNYSTSKTYGPVVLKRTYEEEGVTREQYFLAVKIPANYRYGLMLFGVFHTRGLTGTSLSWDDGFLGTFVDLNNDEYVVHMTWSAGENVAAEANIAKAYDTTFTGTNSIKSAIDVKANDSAVLHKSGQETASGQKWFEGGFCVFNSSHIGYGHFTLAGAGCGPIYNDWTEEQKDGAHFREWSLSFNSGVNFWGKIRITIATSYSGFNASGSMQKTINCAFNTMTVFNNTGYYNDLGIKSENEFRISDLIWNNTTECWEIKIHSIKPTSNNGVPVLLIEFWTYSTSNRDSALGIHWVSTSPSIVTDTTYYTKRSGNASTSPGTGGVQFNWADKPVFQSPYGYEIFDRSHTIPVGNGGTGKTTAKAAEYNLTTGKSEISDTTSGDDRVVFELASPSESNGVTRGFRKLSTIWTWVKGLLSSESGVNISGSSASCTGNAATATELSAGADRTKLDGIAAGAEVNVQSDWNQATTTADDYIKNKPTIPSGTQLVYDCGTGSTSTTDFDNALAAYNAGKWVIINKDGVIYHCVGAYNSNLRFKTFANESDLLKVRALTWTRGFAPAVGTTLEAALTSQIPDISGKVNKSGDTMSGNLTISNGANQGDTKFVTSRTDTGTTGWFGVGDGGQNHGVYSEKAYANTNNDVDNDTKGWVVRTDENGYSSLTGAVNGLFAKDFGASETLRGMKMFKFGYSLDREGDYTHVSATAIIEVRIYYAGVAGSSITMLFNASARGDVGSYYRLQVLSYNNWNLNSVCPVLITREESATSKHMYLGLVGGGPTSTTLRTFNYTEVKVLPLNGTQKFNWSFGWNTNDFNSNTMTMIKPYVYPRAQIGTAIGDAGTPVYVKADGDFGTASGTDVAIALKDAGRADAPVTQDWRVKVGWGGSGVDACAPNGTSTYSAGQTVATTKHLVTAYEYDGVGYYKDVQAGMVTVGNSKRWNGYQLAIQNPGSSPAADTLYIF